MSSEFIFYSGEYKRSFFDKKEKNNIFIKKDCIEGTGFYLLNDELSSPSISYTLQYGEIDNIKPTMYKNDKGILIEYYKKESIAEQKNLYRIVLLGMKQWEECLALLSERLSQYKETEKNRQMHEQIARQEQDQLERQQEQEAAEFYTSCMNFHILKDENPYYELQSEKNRVALIYTDRDHNLNLLKIDGYSKEEIRGVVTYDQIHYYEKDGDVHYISDINGSYAQYGGSISGSTVSPLKTVVAGLLFGPMGMAAGAVLSHKPMQVDLPAAEFQMSTEARQIDNRNVLLNYYSEQSKQYIDIELPVGTFNFLQTHFPQKKYDVVLEMEKQAALTTRRDQQGDLLLAGETAEDKLSMEQFKVKVDKLMMLREAGILTEAEFAAEKQKLLKSL